MKSQRMNKLEPLRRRDAELMICHCPFFMSEADLISYKTLVKKRRKEINDNDPGLCIGSGACVTACPEKDVIGLASGKGALVNASHCVGHGACAQACPVGAITLVFGTETRGVDIPYVTPNFETNVKGVFIVSELGGMGLIKNATVQGREAMEYISCLLKGDERKGDGVYDVLVVGAGPAGISASLAALKNNLKYVTIEQDDIGGAVLSYPRNKIVMTSPVDLPMYGKVKLTETTKEALLE
ncbi:MAG: 4Fe-4S binding protein, partial [Deltaproteobacteria bacterium]|nr:4Fe-4S binding protein [Deltaproteobacteria bacterium]